MKNTCSEWPKSETWCERKNRNIWRKVTRIIPWFLWWSPRLSILGLHFIGVSLEHYHESNTWHNYGHNYHVTEVKIPTPRQDTEQVSSKLHEKAFQDQVERQDHNIHLHHTVISVLYVVTNTFFVYCTCLVNLKQMIWRHVYCEHQIWWTMKQDLIVRTHCWNLISVRNFILETHMVAFTWKLDISLPQ